MVSKISGVIGAIVLACAPLAAAGAGTVVYDTPLLYSFGDCTPGCTPQFQQVYSASLFSGPVMITGIEFEYLQGDLSENYVFTLSTSANPTGALSSVFSENIGADAQQFYSGVLLAPNSSSRANFVGTPFYYDPGNGDLLLDITHATSNNGTQSTYIGGYSASLQSVSRAYSFLSTGEGYVGDQNVGLLTVFTVGAAVPEPANWAMLIAGFGLVGAIQRRRRLVEA